MIYHPEFVAKNIRLLPMYRGKSGLSQDALAQKLHMHPTLLGRYERRISLPLQANYNKLARYFGWEVWE